MTKEIEKSIQQLELLLKTQETAAGKIKIIKLFDVHKNDPAFLEFLCNYVEKEHSYELKHQIIGLLVNSNALFLTDCQPYLQVLLNTLSQETEPELRRIAVVGLSKKAWKDPAVLKVLLQTLVSDMDPAVQAMAARVLAKPASLSDELYEKIREELKIAPRHLQKTLLEIIAKSGKAIWIEAAALALLRVSVSTEQRASALHLLGELPNLQPKTIKQLVNWLHQEPETELLSLLANILFSLNSLDEATYETALRLLLAGGRKSQGYIRLLEPKFHSQPNLLNAFLKVMTQHQDAAIKMLALEMLHYSGLVELWRVFFNDNNPLVREYAVLNATHILKQQPREIILLLLELYRNEKHGQIKKTVLQLLQKHAYLLATVDLKQLDVLFTEKDLLLQREIATLHLSIPIEMSAGQLQFLEKGWIALLKNPALPRQQRNLLLNKLQHAGHLGGPALEEAMLVTLNQIKNFQDLKDYYPAIIKIVKEPAVLLPNLLRLFQKFIGHYPAAPLDSILRLLQSLQTQNAEVLEKLPFIIKTTGESWLLKEVSEEAQKSELYAAILTHLNACEFSRAVILLNEGYGNETLRKKEVIDIYSRSLVHPGMYEMVQALVPIMRKANVITGETLQASLRYISSFHFGQTANSLILDYVTDLGPQIPDYDHRYFELVNSHAFLNFVLKSFDQANDAELSDGKQWDDWRLWQIAYPKWELYERLPDRLKAVWLRKQLEEEVSTDIPVQWTTALFALKQYHQADKIELADLLAIGSAYRQSKGRPGLAFFTDRAACLLSWHWHRFDFSESPGTVLSDDLLAMATEIFADQIYAWLELGGNEFPARVLPMVGISSDRLQGIWAKDMAEWDVFWDAYEELIGVNGLLVIQAEPKVTRYKKVVRFHRLNGSDHIKKLIIFILQTPPPSDENPLLKKKWIKMLKEAALEFPSLFTQYLQGMDTVTKERVAYLLKN